ncbi:hypothetical protein J2X32_003060 [Rheinheimera pacifica]|nr:hypothetical protein [Rheinheimera pacifica]
MGLRRVDVGIPAPGAPELEGLILLLFSFNR